MLHIERRTDRLFSQSGGFCSIVKVTHKYDTPLALAKTAFSDALGKRTGHRWLWSFMLLFCPHLVAPCGFYKQLDISLLIWKGTVVALLIFYWYLSSL